MNCPYCGAAITGTEAVCPSCGTPLTNPRLPSGTRLAGGRYTVGRVLGQGGFGITYQGADTLLGRSVAMKELFPDGSSRQGTRLVPPGTLGSAGFAGARDRFIDEARTLAQFNHPGIVRVIDVLEENGTAYLVMEFLSGTTLGARLEGEGRLPPGEVLRLAVRVGEALTVVHEAGLLHRDIKPDNLFLARDGRVVLIDFGSARGFSGDTAARHTRLVTPGYAPLEQYASEARVGPPTDLYALAATLYHALAGAPPPAATDRLLGAELPPLPPGVPAGLRDGLTRALAIRMAERPQTVREFLDRIGAAGPAPAAPAPPTAANPWAAGRLEEEALPVAGPVSALTWSPDGTMLAVGSNDQSVKRFAPTGVDLEPVGFHFGGVGALAYSPDGRVLSVAGRDGKLRLYGAADGKAVRELTGLEGPATGLAWRPDGSILAATTRNGVVRLLKAAGGPASQEFSGLSGASNALGWSPDGSLLVTSFYDDTARLWDAAAGRPVRGLVGHDGPVLALGWSPDGRTLATGSADSTARVWAPATGQSLLELTGQGSPAVALAWHPDGHALAVGSQNGIIRLYDPAGGALLRTLEPRSPLSALAWSPDGRTLAAGLGASSPRAVVLWRLG